MLLKLDAIVSTKRRKVTSVTAGGGLGEHLPSHEIRSQQLHRHRRAPRLDLFRPGAADPLAPLGARAPRRPKRTDRWARPPRFRPPPRPLQPVLGPGVSGTA